MRGAAMLRETGDLGARSPFNQLPSSLLIVFDLAAPNKLSTLQIQTRLEDFCVAPKKMNVIQLARAQALQEVTEQGRSHAYNAKKQGGHHVLEEGTLEWFGEYVDTRETCAYKIVNGDKQSLSQEEKKLFARTPYERGFMEYCYEGQLRVLRAGFPKDPRMAVREGNGVMKYANGELYEGLWKNNKRHGEGFFTTPSGYKYNGNWADDDVCGKGNETFPCKSAYDCNFEGGFPEGQGVLLFTPKVNDYRYEGEFHDGLRHGKGTIFYENGDTYVGTWDHGRRHGRGVTTTFARGKELQYETDWEQDVLVSMPTIIEKTKRTKKPKPACSYSREGTLVPADLTKWKVKDDVTELPLDHFLRIKLGFERLDVNSSGSLSTAELTELWGSGSQAMLMKLDADGNGTVELDEIFAAWYPSVPQHNIMRFMQQDIKPKTLLRLRGYLAGVRDENDAGYMQVVGVRELEAEEDKPLLIKHLENSGYKIGLEKYTLANYEAAKVLCDPPHFLEVLETWYPNIPRTTLERYEMQSMPQEELDIIRTAFFKLSANEMELAVEDFEDSQSRFRMESLDMSKTIDALATPGFFKGQPLWIMGSVRLSVALLSDIDKFSSKLGGKVSLQQLLRYCFPNVRCQRMQELLTGKRKSVLPTCSCQICSVK